MSRLESTQAELLEHSRALKEERGTYTRIWEALSDYWKLVRGRETIDLAWKAAQKMVNELFNEVDSIDGAWAMDRSALVDPRASVVPVEFLFGTEEYFTNAAGASTRSEFLDEIPQGAVICTPTEIDDQYIIPNWIRTLLSLQDFISLPTEQMTVGNDYFIDSSVLDNKKGTICFNCVIIAVDNTVDFAVGDAVTQAVSGATGTIIALGYLEMAIGSVTGTFSAPSVNAITNTGTGSCTASSITVINSDYKDILWCPYIVAKNHDEIIYPFGKMVGYECRQEGRLELDAFNDVRALMHCLMDGPTSYNIETGISVFNIWPYAPFRGRVTDIAAGNGSITIQNVEDEYETATIVNSTGLAFQQRTESGWVAINVGDTVEEFRAMTKACHMETWVSDPDLLIDFGFTSITGRHVIALIFDAELPLAGTIQGWLPDSSLTSLVIPSVSAYAIDQSRTMMHINRAKNSGTTPFFAVLLNADIDIEMVHTSHGMWINPLVASIVTSLDSLFAPEPSISTTHGTIVTEPEGGALTTYRSMTTPRPAIHTTHGALPGTPDGSMGGTSY